MDVLSENAIEMTNELDSLVKNNSLFRIKIIKSYSSETTEKYSRINKCYYKPKGYTFKSRNNN